jgi:hypothetical protein
VLFMHLFSLLGHHFLSLSPLPNLFLFLLGHCSLSFSPLC